MKKDFKGFVAFILCKNENESTYNPRNIGSMMSELPPPPSMSDYPPGVSKVLLLNVGRTKVVLEYSFLLQPNAELSYSKCWKQK